ncbi:hypothetical protein BV25DRAFT_1440641 [Artomyces pyxidatus]|uniref:Uncharacterized protein n=1 Tax=Artomyces pyxidatus TaxID=48021 RepID=A0ACB8SL90_9AGAM|nr:hypothetical protein BV25DRAFT_1440641 [Artomyces pyxidatus]
MCGCGGTLLFYWHLRQPAVHHVQPWQPITSRLTSSERRTHKPSRIPNNIPAMHLLSYWRRISIYLRAPRLTPVAHGEIKLPCEITATRGRFPIPLQNVANLNRAPSARRCASEKYMCVRATSYASHDAIRDRLPVARISPAAGSPARLSGPSETSFPAIRRRRCPVDRLRCRRGLCAQAAGTVAVPFPMAIYHGTYRSRIPIARSLAGTRCQCHVGFAVRLGYKL